MQQFQVTEEQEDLIMRTKDTHFVQQLALKTLWLTSMP